MRTNKCDRCEKEFKSVGNMITGSFGGDLGTKVTVSFSHKKSIEFNPLQTEWCQECLKMMTIEFLREVDEGNVRWR